MTSADGGWLATTWQFVHEQLPPAPAAVVELGCGPQGGFVPALRSAGYDAVGIDPAAPEGSEYSRIEFERHELAASVDAVVASTSLHHVADLADVVDRIAAALVPDGELVVVEWAHERFDEATARWCFERLTDTHTDAGHDHDHVGWLTRHRDDWVASGQPWEAYFHAWAQRERLHTGDEIAQALQARFDTVLLVDTPYYSADLDRVSPVTEQLAIDAGRISAGGIRYVGRLARSCGPA